jgi:hypothetical protein
MSTKYIEIASENSPPRRFEITEVQKDIFMLKTRDSNA